MAQAAAAGVAVVAALQSMDENNRKAQAEKNALTYNSGVDRQQATLVSAIANVNEGRSRNQSNQVLGEQAASVAQANIGSTGSAYDIQRQSTRNAELDALNIRYGGALARHSYLADAAMKDYQVNQIKQAGKDPLWSRLSPLGFLTNKLGLNLFSPRNLSGTLSAASGSGSSLLASNASYTGGTSTGTP